MGRAPCCDKANVKKGPWSPEEDAKLKSYIEQNGTGGNWIALPQKIGLKRCGKSCRLRWLNYLRPNIKHGGFSEEEDNIICSLYISIGSRWSIIAAQLPGRTDNDIKNYWNTRLKKKLLGKQRLKDQQAARRGSSSSTTGNNGLRQETKRGISSSNTGLISSMVVNPSNNITSTIINSQNPYWPELPVLAPTAYSNEEYHHHHNNHSSIRTLLIKLGGRFSDDDINIINDHHHQVPTDHHHHIIVPSGSTTQQLYDELSGGDMPSSASTPPQRQGFGNSGAAAPFAQEVLLQYSNTTDQALLGSQQILLQQAVQSSTTSLADMHLEETLDNYNLNPAAQNLDGLEFLYGDDSSEVLNGRIINNGGNIINTTNYGASNTGLDIGSWGEMMSSLVYSNGTSTTLVSDYEAMQRGALSAQDDHDQCLFRE